MAEEKNAVQQDEAKEGSSTADNKTMIVNDTTIIIQV